MHCSTCGNTFSDQHTFCPEDGTKLSSSNITTSTEKQCGKCGTTQDALNQFCEHCGASFHLSSPSPSERKAALFSTGKFQKESIKRRLADGLKIAASAFIAMIIVASIIHNSVSNYFLGEFDILSMTGFRLTDFLMYLHSVQVTMTIPGEFLGAQTFQAGVVHGLILMALIFSLVGFIFGKRITTLTPKDKLKLALSSGIVYGLMMAITALIARRTMTIEEFYTTVQVSLSFSMFQAFSVSFITMTLFSFIGFLLASPKGRSGKELHDLLPNGKSIYFGVRAFLITSFTTLAIYTIYIYNSDMMQEVAIFEAGTLAFILSLQAAAYLIPLIHFQTIELQVPDMLLSAYGRETLWLFSASDHPFFLNLEIGGISPFVIAGLLIPVALFVWTGIILHQTYGKSFVKPLLVASGTYTLLSLLLAFFLRIIVSLEGFHASISVTFILSALATFTFSSAVMYVTAWFRS
ncbi:zinc ribbon domain-containing protein [Salipaludibacillus agaradhaerens]|uniref:zinc ribbon domain-containing protein n=1 Tax=Salipaludibacillus agaradhaerens TaxID=76935 RepID=UPI0009977306|nr:zinc ribbon domain-containing protein [Salipaludibacillus agaradhaerens]